MKFWAALSETFSQDFEFPLSLEAVFKTWKSCFKILEIQKPRMAQMVDFFSKPLFKNVKNQSRKGASLETPDALNNNEWSHSLNKVLRV